MPYRKPRPTKHAFVVKKSSAGLGLFAASPIQRKDFVIEYWGTLITDDEAEKKGGKYLFDIQDTKLTIDGATRKNLARYMNHSCKPNCEPILDGKRMFIYAIRNITPGEELTYDYGKEYFDEYIGKKCRCGNHRARRK
jgi:SET domain-containing protein